MRFVVLLLLATACRYREEIDGPDADGDGFGELVDCDDENDSVSPGAAETPYNGVDDDCDETTVDDDVDGDGSLQADDCDDLDPRRHPGAEETCNGLDDDCDDDTDEDVSGPWFTDADDDGYGNPATATDTCTPGTALVALGGDCNDGNEAIHPNAEEDCLPADMDCDGSPDQGVPLDDPGASLWYADTDDDGFGDPENTVTACSQPTGYEAQDGDCDDGVATIHEGAAEICDGLDQDCDSALDDGAGDRTEFFLDDDGDGFGDPDVSVLACAAPQDYIADDTDCDDLSDLTHPGAAEICDGKSNDCDGSIDEDASDRTPFYPDIDDDGFGKGTAVLACSQPADHVANDLDCDDNATNGEDAYPGNVEVCDDDLDNDCDGTVDNAYDALPWYRDADNDDWGDPDDIVWGCDEPTGYVDLPFDCNDGATAVNPDALEVCGGVDEDCSGLTDDIGQGANGQTGGTTWYFDVDGDGWSDGVESFDACTMPSQYVGAANVGDCDETDTTINEGEIEVCDGVDHDCDGFIDGDDDHDGFPGGTDCPSLQRPDCNDGAAGVYPGRGGCAGGESCLQILQNWEDWNFVEGATGATTWTLSISVNGSPEVVCDMVDDADRPGAGWTRIYAQATWANDDGWNFTETYVVPQTGGVDASVSSCGAQGGVLGPTASNADTLGILYKNVDTASVPHTHAWLDMTYIFLGDWELGDFAFIDFEYQDREVWAGRFESTDNTGSSLCDLFAGDRDDLVVDVSRGILHDPVDSALLVLAAANGNDNDEGFAVDDVFVWVR